MIHIFKPLAKLTDLFWMETNPILNYVHVLFLSLMRNIILDVQDFPYARDLKVEIHCTNLRHDGNYS